MKPFAIILIATLAAAGCGPTAPGEDIKLAVEQIKNDKPDRGRATLERLAQNDRADAALVMGGMLSDGQYFRTDAGKACLYYELASISEAAGMHQVARCWERGGYGKKDTVKAQAAYEKAIAMGWTAGRCDYGGMLIRGKAPDPADPVKGAKLCEDAAAAGDHVAAVKIATMYLNGDGVKKDPAKARALFQHAAEGGDGTAALWLGSMYGNGDGGAPDKAAAIRWWGVAYDHGKPEGAQYIGDGAFLKAKKGDKAAAAEAVSWYEKALSKNPSGPTRAIITANLTEARKLQAG